VFCTLLYCFFESVASIASKCSPYLPNRARSSPALVFFYIYFPNYEIMVYQTLLPTNPSNHLLIFKSCHKRQVVYCLAYMIYKTINCMLNTCMYEFDTKVRLFSFVGAYTDTLNGRTVYIRKNHLTKKTYEKPINGQENLGLGLPLHFISM